MKDLEKYDKIHLKELTGLRQLSRVSLSNPKFKDSYYSLSNSIRFTLDGVTYLAIENPHDGYRSSLDYLLKGVEPPQTGFPTTTVFVYIDDTFGNSYYGSEVLVARDMETGRSVLEVGTKNLNDYYPCYVGNFNPQNLYFNND